MKQQFEQDMSTLDVLYRMFFLVYQEDDVDVNQVIVENVPDMWSPLHLVFDRAEEYGPKIEYVDGYWEEILARSIKMLEGRNETTI